MNAARPLPSATAAGELQLLWRLALPLALAQAGQALMGMVDTAVVGRLSPAAQGAAGLGNSLTFTISYFGMGVMMALDPMVSQAIGAGDQRAARAHYRQGVWLAVLVSFVLLVPQVLVPFTLEPFGVAPDVARGAAQFMWWRTPGMLGTLLFIGTRSYLQGVGRTRAIVAAMLVANVANLGLDVLLVFGWGPVPALGIAGAAVATTVCTWLQWAVLAKTLGPAPEGTPTRVDPRALAFVARLGLPIGLHMLAESGLFSLAGLLAGRLGDTSVAAHQIALTWGSLTFCVAVGIGAAGSARVGWAVGARDAAGVRRAGLVAFGSGAAFMALSSLLFVLFPTPLARVMSDRPDVVATASALFWVMAVFQLSDGVQAVGAGALRGLGDTRFAFWANFVGHWCVGLPVAWWLGVRGTLGVIGVWWGLSAGLTAVALSVLGRFVWLTRGPVRALAPEA